jgi:hypothetical protein
MQSIGKLVSIFMLFALVVALHGGGVGLIGLGLLIVVIFWILKILGFIFLPGSSSK